MEPKKIKSEFNKMTSILKGLQGELEKTISSGLMDIKDKDSRKKMEDLVGDIRNSEGNLDINHIFNVAKDINNGG